VVALVGLMLTTVETFVDQYGRGAGTVGQAITNSLAVCAIMGLCAFAALQLPEIASGLAGGGASLSARAISRAMGQIQIATAQGSGAAASAGRDLIGRGAALIRTRRLGGSMEPAE
jgi:type IV secretion system protein VirB6